MRLADIHRNFDTDKGTVHTYIAAYDVLFESIREKQNNILEIGVLTGGSLKMWNAYFENSEIYGVEDFSLLFGHAGAIVNPFAVMSDLAQYPRIHLGSFDSTKCDRADKFFGTTEFDVIIDDASHALENQLANLSVYLPRLKSGGFYIIEDVANESNADVLVRVLQQSPVDVVISRGKIEQREDDRLIVAQRH